MNTTKNKTSKPTTTTPRNTLPLGFQPIQDSCQTYRAELTQLASAVTMMDAAVAAVQAAHMPEIKQRAQATGFAKNRVWSLIADNVPLFEKPKSRVFFDIRVGYRKQPGKLMLDEKKTLALIEKHCPEQIDTLAPATRSISKEALEKLPAETLKKIGVSLVTLTDKIIIEEEKTDVEKVVAALLKQTLANAA
jgi:hypothetical protein